MMIRRDSSEAAARPDPTDVESIFDAALEQPAEQRSAFLSAACSGNELLRSRVERLLACFFNDADLLEQLPVDGFEDDSAGFPAMTPGQRIGPYELIRQLASGGMGTVWLARRADEHFDKKVALKLIKHGMDTEALLVRFRTERQVLASLEHPNISRLLDAGLTLYGLPYLVMEYVDGLPIDRYCDEKRLSVAQRLDLFRSILGAVQYAHQNLVVHRDLKPSNILVAGEGTVKIVDFGIAKVLHANAAESTDATAPQFRIMTPRYASPEQVRGERITTASDIYSLGVILYEMLTGQEPYELTTRSHAEYERAICDQEPRRPSTAVARSITRDEPSSAQSAITPQIIGAARSEDPRRLRRRLSGDLDMIVLKALRKDPQRRYGTAEQFAEDIRRHMASLPIQARPDSWIYRTQKLAARNTGAVAAAGIIAITMVLATGVSISFAQREGRQRVVAEAQKRVADQERDAQRETTAFLLDFLSRVNKEVPGRLCIPTGDIARHMDSAMADANLRAMPEARFRLHHEIGQIFDSASAPEMAQKHEELALDLGTSLWGADDFRLHEIHIRLANACRRRGDFANAEQHARAALDLAERKNPELKVMFNALQQLGAIKQSQGDWASAEQSYRRAIGLCASDGTNINLWADAWLSLGHLYFEQSLLSDARNACEQGLAVLKDHGDLSSLVGARLYVCLGSIAFLEGAFEEADRVLDRAITIRLPKLGIGYYGTQEALLWHGRTLARLGRNAEAISRLEQALLWSAQVSTEPTNAARIRLELAAALFAAGHRDDGRWQLARAITKGKESEPTAGSMATIDQIESAMQTNHFWVNQSLMRALGDKGWLVDSRLLKKSPYNDMDSAAD